MENDRYRIWISPLGPLTLTERSERLVAMQWTAAPATESADTPLLRETERQLAAYFAGRLRQFQLPLGLEGTDFQLSVWRALQEIPYGETAAYADIAARIGCPKAVRAVGMANHRNPLAIIVPCHRVIGRHGQPTGYVGGILRKISLLNKEAAFSGKTLCFPG